MPFKYLPDVALADIAFEATSLSPEGLFEASAEALTDVMVDPSTLEARTRKSLRLSSDDVDTLLYDFLTQVIILKDVESLLFSEFKVILGAGNRSLKAELTGETIDRERHGLRNDVKAVTMHMFGVRKDGDQWKATVVLDI